MALAHDVQGPVPRREDTSRHQAHHPLLDTLGRDVRELQRTLPSGDTDEFVGAATRPDTLLGWLQSDIAANELRPGSRLLTPYDQSVQVHSCHGAARQIDVLREVLLGLLADDSTLEPRDILVMCPDIETYAPLIVAAFGLGEVVDYRHPAHRLRVRLADRSLVQTNPLLGVAAQLLDTRRHPRDRQPGAQPRQSAQSGPGSHSPTTTSTPSRSGCASPHPLGLRRRASDAVPARSFRAEHLAVRARPDPHRRRHVRRSHAWIDTALPLDDVGSDRIDVAGRFAEYSTGSPPCRIGSRAPCR